jgi:nitrogen fixation protein NifQ
LQETSKENAMGSVNSLATAAASHYRRLTPAQHAVNPDDWRALAAAVSLAAAESEAGEEALLARLGLSPDEFERMRRRYFPGLPMVETGSASGSGAETQALITLLLMHRAKGLPEEAWFASIIARRAQEQHHLWQDLGLASRDQLNELIARHFPRLHRKNRNNMKWKKFFYRQICADRSFSLCLAPSCAECNEFAACFSAEEGAPLIAQEMAAV